VPPLVVWCVSSGAGSLWVGGGGACFFGPGLGTVPPFLFVFPVCIVMISLFCFFWVCVFVDSPPKLGLQPINGAFLPGVRWVGSQSLLLFLVFFFQRFPGGPLLAELVFDRDKNLVLVALMPPLPFAALWLYFNVGGSPPTKKHLCNSPLFVWKTLLWLSGLWCVSRCPLRPFWGGWCVGQLPPLSPPFFYPTTPHNPPLSPPPWLG